MARLDVNFDPGPIEVWHFEDHVDDGHAIAVAMNATGTRLYLGHGEARQLIADLTAAVTALDIAVREHNDRQDGGDL